MIAGFLIKSHVLDLIKLSTSSLIAFRYRSLLSLFNTFLKLLGSTKLLFIEVFNILYNIELLYKLF